MDDRKGKRKIEEREINESSSDSSESVQETAPWWTTATYSGEDGDRSAGASATASGALPIRGRDIIALNAPSSAPVAIANQPTGRPMGQQQLSAAPGGIWPGGSNPMGQQLLGLQGQTQAQSSGSMPPQPVVCPVCHGSSFCNTICVRCAPAFAGRVISGYRPTPPRPPQREQRSQGLLQERWPPSPTYPASIANRPTEQLLRGLPLALPAMQSLAPGLQPATQAHPVPRADTPMCPACQVNPRRHGCICSQCRYRGIVCVCASAPAPPPVAAISAPPQPHVHDHRFPRPQQHAQPPPPVGAGAQQQQEQRLLQYMPELAAAIRPLGEHGGAPGAAEPVLLPDLQQPPQAQPVPRDERLVGFDYDPLMLGHAGDPEDGWCPACRHYPARKMLEPRTHDCVCYICCYVDGIVCRVCHPHST